MTTIRSVVSVWFFYSVRRDNLAKTTVTQGLFLVLVGRTQAPVWVGEVWAMMPGDDVLTMPIARRIEMFTHYLR
jgi:hypothetical protein